MKKIIWGMAALAATNTSFSFPHPETFQSTYVEVEEQILRYSLGIKNKGAKSAIRKELLDVILNDKKNLVNADFDIPDYFLPSTKFWFSVYSQYSSQQVLIHDKENLDLVYTVMDFEELHNSKINKFAKSKLQADLALEQSKRIKKLLKRLHLPESQLNVEEKALLSAIKNSSLKVPKAVSLKKKFFSNLSSQIRTQTGQRDMVFAGVLRSLPYLPFLETQFENFKIPKELLAIAFVESSFNVNARSYAGAAGIWQFMPTTAAAFMPERSHSLDYRVNPIIASVAAMHLLKQNKQILKRWDLAIPAYNFGTSHLVKARRKYKDKATLAYVLENYKHDQVGFASKNYFSEVLAMARVLAYRNMIFPLKGYSNRSHSFNKDNLAIYVTKCRLRPQRFFRLLDKSSPGIKMLNSHFLKTKPSFSSGLLVVSDVNLTSRKYRRVSENEIKKFYPKNLFKLAKNLKCGK